MQSRIALMLLITLVSPFAVRVPAQENSDAAQRVENLREQLSNVEDRLAGLKIRLEELNFDLKPENIERYFNGVGSTRPEELRELRRRQLQTEKDRVVRQLEELTSSCARLEAAINSTQVRAVQQKAAGAFALQTNQSRANFLAFARVLIVIIALCVVLGGIAFYLLIRRRKNV